MRYVVLNLAALSALAIGALGHAVALLSPENAFFLALFGMALYTGSQLAAREGMTVGEALASLLRPASYPTRRAGQVAYLGATALGAVALVQIAASAA
ncbi:MAG: hypothetical protein H6923_04490 [Alphaproteobacteria bacterium]|nr:hypothetical protein [Alphaproteobacteria bacterium]